MKPIMVNDPEVLALVDDIVKNRQSRDANCNALKNEFDQKIQDENDTAAKYHEVKWQKICDILGIGAEDRGRMTIDAEYRQDCGVVFLKEDEDAQPKRASIADQLLEALGRRL